MTWRWRLHSIVTATPMETYQVQLHRDMKLGALKILDPHPPTGLTWGDHGVKDLFLDTAEIDFEPFINAWILLHEKAMAAVAVAAPRNDKQFLTSKLVDTRNGLEALASQCWVTQCSDKRMRRLQVLKDAGCNRRPRETTKSCLLMRRRTLEESSSGSLPRSVPNRPLGCSVLRSVTGHTWWQVGGTPSPTVSHYPEGSATTSRSSLRHSGRL